jgi:hypothetical protein
MRSLLGDTVVEISVSRPSGERGDAHSLDSAFLERWNVLRIRLYAEGFFAVHLFVTLASAPVPSRRLIVRESTLGINLDGLKRSLSFQL